MRAWPRPQKRQQHFSGECPQPPALPRCRPKAAVEDSEQVRRPCSQHQQAPGPAPIRHPLYKAGCQGRPASSDLKGRFGTYGREHLDSSGRLTAALTGKWLDLLSYVSVQILFCPPPLGSIVQGVGHTHTSFCILSLLAA